MYIFECNFVVKGGCRSLALLNLPVSGPKRVSNMVDIVRANEFSTMVRPHRFSERTRRYKTLMDHGSHFSQQNSPIARDDLQPQ
jgi:hypothetical protein